MGPLTDNEKERWEIFQRLIPSAVLVRSSLDGEDVACVCIPLDKEHNPINLRDENFMGVVQMVPLLVFTTTAILERLEPPHGA